MPTDLLPPSIADMPAQKAGTPATPAVGRWRFLHPVNAFNLELLPVPDHCFTEEPWRSLNPATPTSLIPCDLSATLASPFPATAPLVLVRYAKIRAGETLTTDFAASGIVVYVIRGSGTTSCAGESIAWSEGDLFILPGGVRAVHAAASGDAVVWMVANEH